VAIEDDFLDISAAARPAPVARVTPPVTHVTPPARTLRAPRGLWVLALGLLLAPQVSLGVARAAMFFVPAGAKGQSSLVIMAFAVVAACFYTWGRYPCWAGACYVGWLLWCRGRPTATESAVEA